MPIFLSKDVAAFGDSRSRYPSGANRSQRNASLRAYSPFPGVPSPCRIEKYVDRFAVVPDPGRQESTGNGCARQKPT
jgi:hypothetical protein